MSVLVKYSHVFSKIVTYWQVWSEIYYKILLIMSNSFNCRQGYQISLKVQLLSYNLKYFPITYLKFVSLLTFGAFYGIFQEYFKSFKACFMSLSLLFKFVFRIFSLILSLMIS